MHAVVDRKVMIQLLLLVLSGLTMFLGKATAQTQFGVRAGVNMSRMADKASDSEYLFGMHGGIYFRGTDPWTVQVEMQYSGQGGTFRDLSTGQTVEKRLHYLNPSLLARYSPSESISFLGGVQLGVLIVARTSSSNISDDYDPMDLGLHFGVDYNFSKRWSGSSRFLQSLRNVGNQVIQVSIGYTIQERI